MAEPQVIPLARPSITDADRQAVDRVLRSVVLSRGPELDAFQLEFAAYCGSPFAVGLSSGTAAIHLGLLALGVGPEQRVITTPFSVPASVNPVLATGAGVVFVDIEEDTRALNPDAVAAVLSADDVVLAVHAFGEPAPVATLSRVCDDRGAVLVEDACEALGTRIDGCHAGRRGAWGAFGFYPNKQLTTGEGGMLITADEELAGQVGLLANHGRTMNGHWLDQALPGYNYRLSEIAAALGRSQLERLPATLARRHQLARRYRERLERLGLRLPAEHPETSLFAYVVGLPTGCTAADRDRLIEHLAAAGIQSGRYFAPLHLQPGLSCLGYGRGDFPVAESVSERALALPFFAGLGEREIDRVAAALEAGLSAGN